MSETGYNPREALTRAVNRAIADGAPVYVDQPAAITREALARAEHAKTYTDDHTPTVRDTNPKGDPMTDAEAERVIDRAIQRRLATDPAYRNAANAEEQSQREEEITRQAEADFYGRADLR